jgi:hypothetical protein
MKYERDVEELLERFSPRPSPPGLKERTIQAAEQKARDRRLLTPGWRWVLATSLVLFAIFMLADLGSSSLEKNRLNALLDLPGEKALSPEKQADEEAAELLANLPDLDAASEKLLRRFILDQERAAAQSLQSARSFTEGIHEY